MYFPDYYFDPEYFPTEYFTEESVVIGARQPISVDQLHGGGSHYPFVQPSDDIRFLWGEAYLGYQDPHCLYSPPFRVAWMFGFGSEAVSPPPGFSSPTHGYDVVIVDANNQVVFDSTEASGFQQVEWSDRLEVLEWQTTTAVLRVTRHMGWPPDQDPILYDEYIMPENGQLVDRVCVRLGPRVTSLQIGVAQYRDRIKLVAGFNQLLEVGDTVRLGERLVTPITFRARPGDGLGRFPACDEVVPVIRVINGQLPDSSGNFILQGGARKVDETASCLRVQRPLEISQYLPRQATLQASGLTNEEAAAALLIEDDCSPCCTCDDFINTYEALRRIAALYEDLGERGQEARDLHSDNIDRWNAQKACREAEPLRLLSLPGCPCKVQYGVVYCNTTDECLQNVNLRLEFNLLNHGAASEELEADVVCNSVIIDGTQFEHSERYVLGGSWPTYTAHWDYLDANDAARLRFRLDFGNECQAGQSVRLTATATAVRPNGGVPSTSQTITSPLLPSTTPGEDDCEC